MTRMWLVDPYHVLSTGEEWVYSVAFICSGLVSVFLEMPASYQLRDLLRQWTVQGL